MARRAVLVIHGVGSQKKGEFFNDTVEPFIRFLHRFRAWAPGAPKPMEVQMQMRPDHGPAGAVLRFGGGADYEEWRFTEVWWAQTFHPSPADPVMRWGFSILVRHFLSLAEGIFLRHLRCYGDAGRSADPVYQNPATAWYGRIYDFVIALVIGLIYFPVWGLVLLLASLFYFLAQLPTWLLIVGPAVKIQRALLETLVEGIGDLEALMSNHLALHSAGQTVLDALAPYLDRQHPEHLPCDTLTVIAHSGGAVVAYQALSDPQIKRWMQVAEAAEALPQITWFTVGSGLNIAYRIDAQHPLWGRQLDLHVKWVNLWARYDPVTHGPPPPGMTDRLRGAVSTTGFEDLRVVNRDNPFSDHFEYWRNYEEVVSRFVYEIMGRPQAGGTLRPAVDTCVAEIKTHRRGVARIVWLRMAVAVVGIALARWFRWDEGLGQWLVSLLREAPLPAAVQWMVVQSRGFTYWLIEAAPWPVTDVVQRAAAAPLLATLLGLIGLAIPAYLAYRLMTLWGRDLFERGPDWR